MIKLQPILEISYTLDSLPDIFDDIKKAFKATQLGNGRGHYIVTITRRYDDFIVTDTPPTKPLLSA